MSHEEKKLAFELVEASDEPNETEKLNCEVSADCLSMAMKIEGYSDCASADNEGYPFFVEYYEGELRLLVFADINQEDPTHVISLEGARNTARVDEAA